MHDFEDMETVPATEVEKTSSNVQMVVAEMKHFRQFYLETVREGRNDIRQFWLRKTKKPVLAVLLVEQPGGGLVMYRGTNMEVSMPTGSLCAERNVIGSALATNPGLKREDLRLVAVLAVPLPNEESTPPSRIPSPPPSDQSVCSIVDPSGADTVSLFSEVESTLLQQEQRENISRSMSIGSFASIIECDDDCHTDIASSWVIDGGLISEQHTPTRARHQIVDDSVHITSSGRDRDSKLIMNRQPEEGCKAPTAIDAGAGTPIRRIKLYAESEIATPSVKHLSTSLRAMQGRKKKRTVLVHSNEDINPLKPCGACNEWLKKIAESNPSFKVVTFTDADCNGVYVTPCQE